MPSCEENMMFVRIRKYTGCTDAKEVNRLAQAEVLPVLRKVPGFRSYVVIAGNHTMVSISTFDSKASVETANQRAREVVQKSIAKFLPNPPEITMGELLAEAK
jgi:hypothetical protein